MPAAAPLGPQLRDWLRTVRDARAFSPEAWIAAKCARLNEYMRGAGLRACVVNMSGGVDSAVTLALAARASALQSSPIARVLGVAQPIESTPGIQGRAYEMSGVAEIVTVDQTQVFRDLRSSVSAALGVEPAPFADGNLKSYMRTPVAFYVAQILCQQGAPAIVLGTGNLDEDGFLYYFSKAGDGVSDVQLIADLHKSEVFAVGAYLGVPSSIMLAPPSADLWPGQTDEGEIGATYDAVELYVTLRDNRRLFLQLFTAAPQEVRDEYLAIAALLEGIHARNSHKAHFPLNL